MEFYGDVAVMQDALARFAAGDGEDGYRWLGCHALPGQGYVFRLWAPDAAAVSLIGDFNGWDGSAHPMESLGEGVWECACQSAAAYMPYKYHIVSLDGQAMDITDPMAVAVEQPPGDAGLVMEAGGYPWQADKLVPSGVMPLNIYRIPTGGWRRYADGRPYDFAMLAEQLVPYVAELGYTHLLLEGMTVAPMAPDGRLGTPHDLMALVDACHLAGVGVLLSLPSPSREDFDSPPRRAQALASALYWLEEYRFDGVSVPVAASLFLDAECRDEVWATNPQGGRENRAAIAFWRQFTATLKAHCPAAWLIATGGDVWAGTTDGTPPDGLGFTHVLATDWAADMAHYTALPFTRRVRYPQLLTASLLHAFAQHYVLPLCPDGAVYPAGAMPGDYRQRLAGLRALLGYQMAHPGAKLTAAGVELGQLAAIAPEEPPDWLLLDYEEHRMMRHYATTLNRLYRDTPALWEQDDSWEGLRWISDEEAADGVLAFYRVAAIGKPLVAVMNLQPVLREEYPLGLPLPGEWVEVLRSDLAEFGGEATSCRRFDAWPMPLGGQPASLKLQLPPLSVLFLQPAQTM